MAYSTLSAGGVFYCVWGETRVQDIKEVLNQVKQAVSEFGRPVVYITRVPFDASPPDSETRSYINTIMPELTELCAGYHVILEGSGLASAIKRGVLMGLFQVRRRRNIFHVHADANEVVEHVASDRRDAVRELLERAEARGILRGSIPV